MDSFLGAALIVLVLAFIAAMNARESMERADESEPKLRDLKQRIRDAETEAALWMSHACGPLAKFDSCGNCGERVVLCGSEWVHVKGAMLTCELRFDLCFAEPRGKAIAQAVSR